MRIPFEACPLCESRRFSHALVADCTQHALYRPPLPATIEWCRCDDCGHVFTAGTWSAEAERILFSAVPEGQRVGQEMEIQRLVSARMIERMLPYKASGRWLDVGFGNGSLIFTAREFGFEAVGLDLREAGLAALRRLGIEAHRCDITEFAPARPFDVISMADVLEHMRDPRRGLIAAHRLLADGGVLLVSMPNMESDLWRAMDQARANPYWIELEHYHNFGRSRLYSLLRQHGMEPMRYAVSERYRACMEVIAVKRAAAGGKA